ncbi:PKD domain-containing protein [Nocardioides sp. YIM 152588]|uniref:PKD domain-containing protein n=1 Tax=Nocardioides sp. YIM 152588 TaxID=3158259 RepID=UPI0032E42F69
MSRTLARLGLVAATGSLSLVIATAPATADVDGGTDNSGITIGASEEIPDDSAPPESDNTTGATAPIYHEYNACALESAALCYEPAVCPDGQNEVAFWYTDPETGNILSEGTYCPGEDEAAEPATITLGMVLEAFRRIPLHAAELAIEPPDGRTLVNFETNFYSPAAPLERTVVILGQRVDLHITIATYHWDFGDGTTRDTTTAGAPYPALALTHNYRHTGRYHPRLDATYTADYRVNGGPWQPVDGTVTISGAPTTLTAVEAHPTLVGYGD